MSIFYQPSLINELISAAAETGINDINTLSVALKGTNKEYLFADTQQLTILKKGFMTGHTFGGGIYSMPYQNISGVRVEFHFASGYFEVSAGGMQNTPKSYWENGKDSPQQSPNTISLVTGNKDAFMKAADIINGLISSFNQKPSSTRTSVLDPVEQIKRYKDLADTGVISQEEFDAKKKQLLDL